MIRSMTGFGRAQWHDDRWRVSVEVRSVNQRGLKLTLRTPDSCRRHEPEIEGIIRAKVSRGHVFCVINCEPRESAADAFVDRARLDAYLRVVRELGPTGSAVTPETTALLLDLPDVVKREPLDEESFQSIWPNVKDTITSALTEMVAMREDEGRNLVAQFRDIARELEQRVDRIEERAPLVIEQYRDRLLERVQELLDGTNVKLTMEDLHRELAFFAERSDITEELARLRSHIHQFLDSLESDEPVGRKLEFLTQEMFREANTTAAKANDQEIVHAAVDVKTDVDRMREQVLNIE